MIRPILRWVGRRHQRRLGVETPYLEEVVEHAPGALVPILGFASAAAYGGHLPGPLARMVRLGATLAQDCGTCLAIEVKLALDDGVPEEVVDAALSGAEGELDTDLSVGLRFGERLGRGLEVEEERGWIEERFGTPGVVEASIAAAGALTFPTVQRGMGHARACDVAALRPGAASR